MSAFASAVSWAYYIAESTWAFIVLTLRRGWGDRDESESDGESETDVESESDDENIEINEDDIDTELDTDSEPESDAPQSDPPTLLRRSHANSWARS